MHNIDQRVLDLKLVLANEIADIILRHEPLAGEASIGLVKDLNTLKSLENQLLAYIEELENKYRTKL